MSNRMRGGVMIEFTLVVLLLFSLIGLLLDVGVFFYRYSLLVHALTTTARRVAVDAGGANSCNALRTSASSRAEAYLSNSFGINTSSITFVSGVVATPGGACVFRIEGRWPFNCLVCNIFPRGTVIRSEANALIEDECYACSSSCT
jgi:hypothetical protein